HDADHLTTRMDMKLEMNADLLAQLLFANFVPFTSKFAPPQNKLPADHEQSDSRSCHCPQSHKPDRRSCRNKRRTVRANQSPSRRAARSHNNLSAANLS